MIKRVFVTAVISVFIALPQSNAYLSMAPRVLARPGSLASCRRLAVPSLHVHMKADDEDVSEPTGFDPLDLARFDASTTTTNANTSSSGKETTGSSIDMAVSVLLLAVPLLLAFGGETAWAALGPSAAASFNSQAMFDPSNFQPVCPASDGVYNVLKAVAGTVVGSENIVEYGPLIASVLLRIRLELCVLESFLYEAVIPFIQKKGLSWVLPFHETVETFLAGTIFAVGTNFILLGSTKILSILFIYADVITGMPSRFVGAQIEKSQQGAVKNAGKVLKVYGDVLGGVRSFLEAGDTFVGRYLVILTTVYIAFKLAHYKLFNDILPF